MNPYQRLREQRAEQRRKNPPHVQPTPEVTSGAPRPTFRATHRIAVTRDGEPIGEWFVMRIPSRATEPAAAPTSGELDSGAPPLWAFHRDPARWLIGGEEPPPDIGIEVEDLEHWQPTHRLELTEPLSNSKTYALVMVQADGSAPTFHEWSQGIVPGWRFERGRWTLHGEPPAAPLGFQVLEANDPEAAGLPPAATPGELPPEHPAAEPAPELEAPPLHTEPAPPLEEGDEELGRFLADVFAEVHRDRRKFPDPVCLVLALTEEVGELAKAVLEEPADRVRSEAIQVAAVAARIALEGDPLADSIRLDREQLKLGR